ncbi:protein kinase [Trypanosoma rangeli]|uniref:Protein kinase n=1 Tax=Trypanosoma rangeli TaxID=5698 RepID=A0A422MYH6_TRYRA|nr:protein kinase [Trypanosoma rangeli]RNE98220.1 protein kinase [Trypanosoma rangeli]|eukprot:RNE98220.1 protein kinase [Trypanosoma rangeli]
MIDEVWEVTSSETQRIAGVLTFLRRNTCPYIGRPVLRRYREGNEMEGAKEKKSASPLRILLSYSFSQHTVTLHQFLQMTDSLHREVKLSLAHQLVQAIAFLHTCGVSHQFLSSDVVAVELKPEPTVRIIHFCGGTTSSDCGGSYICVRNYRPPEVLLQLSGLRPKAIDCWALGCLLFEIYTGSAAFSLEASDGNFRPGLVREQLTETVRVIGKLGEDNIPPGCSDRVSEFLLGLDYDASFPARMRLAAPEEETEVWISLVRALLRFNFHLRPSVEELLRHELFADLPPPFNWPVPDEESLPLHTLLE